MIKKLNAYEFVYRGRTYYFTGEVTFTEDFIDDIYGEFVTLCSEGEEILVKLELQIDYLADVMGLKLDVLVFDDYFQTYIRPQILNG